MDNPEQNMWSTQLIFLVVMYPQRMDGKEFIQRGVFLMNTLSGSGGYSSSITLYEA